MGILRLMVILVLVWSGFISIFMRISDRVVFCIFICVVRRSGVNVMV